MLDEGVLLDELLNYFIHVERKSLQLVQRGLRTRDELLQEAAVYLRQNKVAKAQIPSILHGFERFIWGYHVLEDAINDQTISDIKVLSEDNVRIKRKGKRMTSDIHFRNRDEYRRFVDLVAVKNKTNLSDINALQCFTDRESNSDYILRFNIATDFVNSVDVPYLHIRKIPKQKYTLQQLITEGMLSVRQADFLKQMVSEARGILFTGKGASGKTTLMNTLLEQIPHERSGLIIQENEELFSNVHPDLMFQHVVTSRGEGKIQYTLKELARNGLLTDLDYFIIGEIKGGEALYLLNASYTGHHCWASVHGMNSREAMNKLADYVKYESDYTKADILSMLVGIELVVYLENFKVKEITRVVGFADGDLQYECVEDD